MSESDIAVFRPRSSGNHIRAAILQHAPTDIENQVRSVVAAVYRRQPWTADEKLAIAKIIDPAAFAPSRRDDDNMSASDALGKAVKALDLAWSFFERA